MNTRDLRNERAVDLLNSAARAWQDHNEPRAWELLFGDWVVLWGGAPNNRYMPADLRARYNRAVGVVTECLKTPGYAWTSNDVDWTCPHCGQSVATISGHLYGNRECQRGVRSRGHVTEGGLVGTVFADPAPADPEPKGQSSNERQQELV